MGDIFEPIAKIIVFAGVLELYSLFRVFAMKSGQQRTGKDIIFSRDTYIYSLIVSFFYLAVVLKALD